MHAFEWYLWHIFVYIIPYCFYIANSKVSIFLLILSFRITEFWTVFIPFTIFRYPSFILLTPKVIISFIDTYMIRERERERWGSPCMCVEIKRLKKERQITLWRYISFLWRACCLFDTLNGDIFSKRLFCERFSRSLLVFPDSHQ